MTTTWPAMLVAVLLPVMIYANHSEHIHNPACAVVTFWLQVVQSVHCSSMQSGLLARGTSRRCLMAAEQASSWAMVRFSSY
jgi:hypothetical protein